MNGPIFSGGEEFTRLWAEVPKVVTYRDYIEMCNGIDSARMDRMITDRDEHILLAALEAVKKYKKITADEDLL